MDKPKRRKTATERKAEIIETVLDLSAQLGPDRVTTQHVADAVGVTQPAIFRHFSSKSQLWHAVTDKIVGDLDEASNDETPHRTLHDLFSRFFDLVHTYPALPSILHSHEILTDYDGLRARFATLRDDRIKQIAALIASGQSNGSHRGDILAEDAASLIHSAVHGLCLHWSLESHDFDLRAQGERLIDTFLDSLKPI